MKVLHRSQSRSSPNSLEYSSSAVVRQFTVIVTSIAVTSAIAYGGYYLGQGHASRAGHEPNSTVSPSASQPFDDNERLVQAIERLDRRLAAVEIRQAYTKSTESQSPASSPGGSPPPLDLAAAKERELKNAAAIEAALRTQPRDMGWASTTEGQLQTAVNAAVNEEGAKFSVKSLKCLTSICEMVLSASSPDQLRHVNFQLVPRISGMGSIDLAQPETAADGSATVTCRMFREGYPRPADDR